MSTLDSRLKRVLVISVNNSEPVALIVDDDFMFVMHASSLLSDIGYRVMEVPDAEQAMTLIDAEDGQIDVVLIDVNLPGMDGFKLARIVHDRWPKIRLLIASGHSVPPVGSIPQNATFFPKPIDWSAVRTALHSGL